MSEPLARALSIAGHPMLVTPLAALLLASRRGDAALAGRLALGFALFAVVVMGWSWWQVRRGRWAHVDASHREERRSLNLALLAAFALGAALSALAGAAAELVLGLALAAAIVAVALACVRLCKLSLHLAFAVYAACLLWPLGPAWTLAMLCMAAAIAWSRLRLQRHRPRDLIAGALAGGAAGAILLVRLGT
ncbi:phosphatase PAP2 family protein [Pseudoxanthomonas mexicana]|uniref:phosphatase PAP2 family protein n=1 Tax=Pseudoxanthomonas mexicana TaxID=128785 RepID=UPI00398AF15E